MNDHPDHFKLAYIVMAALAGSVTALSFMKWQEMSWATIGLTLFAGFTFAIFLVPYLAAEWAGIDTTNLRAICAVVYLGGMSSNALMPLVIKKAQRVLGVEDQP